MGLIVFGGLLALIGFVILGYAGSEITWASSGFYSRDAGFPALVEYGSVLIGIGIMLSSLGAVVAVSASGLR